MSNATMVSLFSGGGLADVGFKRAGFTPVGAVEFDASIAEWYTRNHGDHCTVGDVAEVDYRPWAGVDLLHASPVCTNASVANSGAGEDPLDLRSADAVCRALREMRPRWFTLENVAPYARFESFRRIVEQLRVLGYQCEYRTVMAADYGVPQTRKRLILRASLTGRVPALPRTHCEGGQSGGLFEDAALLPWVGWYAAIEDLIPTLPASKFADWQLKRLEASVLKQMQVGPNFFVGGGNKSQSFLDFAVENRASIPGIRNGDVPMMTVPADAATNACGRAFLVESKNANQQYGDGLRGMDEPATTVITDHKPSHMPKALLVDGDGNRSREPTVLEAADPSMTVQAWHGRRPVQMPRAWMEQGRVVAMTPRALARFQSLPDSYALPEKAQLACRIVGNGCPSLLMEHIGRAFLEATP